MGRKSKSKQFIGKGEGQKYILVHRSQTDDAYKNEQKPSDFVLMKSSEIGVDHEIKKTTTTVLQSDHITSLGFKNDGYDYSQHLRVMGGGRFVGRDGRVRDMPLPVQVNLPMDALPSDFELDRDLGAVTIDADLMDKDIAAALFGDDTQEFEELADDFVMEAMQAPAEPDFDFDAHIARLIAQSERQTGVSRPRGWGHDMDGVDGVDGGGPDDVEHGEEVDSFAGSEEGDVEETQSTMDRRHGMGMCSEERMAFLDAQLETTLEEYGEDDIGDLGEVEGGGVDWDDDNVAFRQAIDEFLQDKADQTLAEGVLVTKGARVLPEDGQKEKEGEEGMLAAVSTGMTCMSLEDGTVEEADEDGDGDEGGVAVDLLTCQEYLRETRVQLDWDCESVLSTYSTLDNHPTLISVPGRRRRRTVPETDGAVSGAAAEKASPAPARILLTGKHALPRGFAPRDTRLAPSGAAGGISTGRQLSASTNDVVTPSITEEGVDSEGSEEGGGSVDVTLVRRRGETAEERRARKTKVKEDKRARRKEKKHAQDVFRQEASVLMSSAICGGNIDPHVSVFKY